MRNGKLIAGLVLVVVATMAGGTFMTYRWVKNAFGDVSTDSQPKETTPSNNKAAASVPVASPPIVIKGAVMAQAFRNGRLPAPLAQPGGTPEQAAAELAKRVMAEDEQSTAALETALQMAGFSVRGDDGSLALESVKSGQGIVIDAWEVAALAKLLGDGMQTPLTDFSNSFASTIRPLKNAPVAELFLKGLRGAAKSDRPSLRFWADFIAELGRQSGQPYDLLASDLDPAKVNLDAVQSSLILRRFVADLMVARGNKTQKAEFAPAWKPAAYGFEGQTIRNAVWHPNHRPHLLRIEEGGGSSQPCTLKELEAQILDVTAYSYTKAFDSMLDYLGEHGMEGAEKYSKTSSAINAILALIKLYAYYACMETDITMSGEPPLVRTQDIYKNGERRTLTATVRENIGKWQALNCARIALNGANFDISLPNDGPVAGVKTQWVLTGGGRSVSNNVIIDPIVELIFPDGTPRIQDAMVPISDASAPKTDEEGHTTIDIEGVKQREKLSSPIPLMKQAEVRFTVAAKPVSMSQDIIDAVGTGTGGPVGIFVAGPVEMLLRSNMYMSKKLLIPVKDWDSCDGGWAGNITYTATSHWDHTSNEGGHTTTETRDETTRAEVRLRGDLNAGAGWSGPSNGDLTASFVGTHNATDRFYDGCTTKANEIVTAAGGGPVVVEIHPEGDNKYEISSTSIASVPDVDLVHRSASGCPGKPGPDSNTNGSMSFGIPKVTGQEDPKHPGVLRGTETLPPPRAGETLTVSWNLTQCQNRK